MGTIVLGYDGSDGADAALKVTSELALATGDAVVIVFGYAQFAPGGESRDHELAVAEIAKERLANGVAALTETGVTCESMLVHNHPQDALMEVAEQRKARMIVVGSASVHPLVGALLGSTAYKLVNRADVPVLVVPV